MLKARHLASCIAISALTAMAGCSALGMGGNNQQAAMTAPPPAAPAPMPAATPQNVELSPSLIRRVQTVLKRDGMYRGRVDGIWGPATQRGVTQFQQKNNLQASGSIDGPTLDAMNLSGAAGGGSMSGGNMGAGSSDMGSGAATTNGNMNNTDNMSGSPVGGAPTGSAGPNMGGGAGSGGGGGGHS